MKVTLNNEVYNFDRPVCLAQALDILGYQEIKMAVAVNQIIIPTSMYASTQLKDNDVLDIIVPMQGG